MRAYRPNRGNSTVGRWVRRFTEDDASQREPLGNKRANLTAMTRLGLPIPPGLIATTEACRELLKSDTVPEGLWEEAEYGLRSIAHLTAHAALRTPARFVA